MSTTVSRKLERRVRELRETLRQPGRELVLEHRRGGHSFLIIPGNVPVSHEEAAALIQRNHVRAYSPGLLVDHPQSWVAN